jgi:hypothetical protein
VGESLDSGCAFMYTPDWAWNKGLKRRGTTPDSGSGFDGCIRFPPGRQRKLWAYPAKYILYECGTTPKFPP